MSTNTNTELRRKTYIYVRINVPKPSGTYTTISIHPKEYNSLVMLARGSVSSTVEARISEVCREAARELLATGCSGKLSAAVRALAFAKLRGSYREHRALAYDRAQFPEGHPLAA